MANVKALVVAGGGAGSAGGGGGGGYQYDAAFAVTAQEYSVTVGNGGTPGTNMWDYVNGANGQNSVFDTITATGGGGGSCFSTTGNQHDGSNGGSGGGGGCYDPVGSLSSGGTVSQGYDVGDGY